jgi:hypothetical protein
VGSQGRAGAEQSLGWGWGLVDLLLARVRGGSVYLLVWSIDRSIDRPNYRSIPIDQLFVQSIDKLHPTPPPPPLPHLSHLVRQHANRGGRGRGRRGASTIRNEGNAQQAGVHGGIDHTPGYKRRRKRRRQPQLHQRLVQPLLPLLLGLAAAAAAAALGPRHRGLECRCRRLGCATGGAGLHPMPVCADRTGGGCGGGECGGRVGGVCVYLGSG